MQGCKYPKVGENDRYVHGKYPAYNLTERNPRTSKYLRLGAAD